MRQMRQELDKQSAHHDDLRVKLLELELMMKWQDLREKQGARQASQVGSSRPASAASSRGVSPSPLEHKALLKLEAQVCASMGDYRGMIKRAQQLSAANKNYSAQPIQCGVSSCSEHESSHSMCHTPLSTISSNMGAVQFVPPRMHHGSRQQSSMSSSHA